MTAFRSTMRRLSEDPRMFQHRLTMPSARLPCSVISEVAGQHKLRLRRSQRVASTIGEWLNPLAR
jgi:hypothetical protein